MHRTRVTAVEVERSVLKVESTNLDMGFAMKREVKVMTPGFWLGQFLMFYSG